MTEACLLGMETSSRHRRYSRYMAFVAICCKIVLFKCMEAVFHTLTYYYVDNVTNNAA